MTSAEEAHAGAMPVAPRMAISEMARRRFIRAFGVSSRRSQKGAGGMVGRKHYSAAPEAYNRRRTPRGASPIEGAGGAGAHTTYAARLSNRTPAATAIAESAR